MLLFILLYVAYFTLVIKYQLNRQNPTASIIDHMMMFPIWPLFVIGMIAYFLFSLLAFLMITSGMIVCFLIDYTFKELK